jgi:dolichol-phosphate mannosyltransferase
MNSYQVVYKPVNDRARLAGQSKYTNFNRALTGIYDLFGVVWLRKRTKTPYIEEDSAHVKQVDRMAVRKDADAGARHAAGE